MRELLTHHPVRPHRVKYRKHDANFPNYGEKKTSLLPGLLKFTPKNLFEANATNILKRFGNCIWPLFHKAANTFPLRHRGNAAAGIDHQHPALLVGTVGFMFLALEREPQYQAAMLGRPISAQIGDAGGDGIHALPGHEPVITIWLGNADFAALAVEADRRRQWFAPLFDKEIPKGNHYCPPQYWNA